MKATSTNTPYNSIYSVIPQPEPIKTPKRVCCVHGVPCVKAKKPEPAVDDETSGYANLFPTKAEKEAKAQKKAQKETKSRSRNNSVDFGQLQERLANLSEKEDVSKSRSKRPIKPKEFRAESNDGSAEQTVDFDKSDTPEELVAQEKQPDFDVKSDKRDSPEDSDSACSPKSKKSKKKAKKSKKNKSCSSKKSSQKSQRTAGRREFYLGECDSAQAEGSIRHGVGLYHRIYAPKMETPLFVVYREADGKFKHFRVGRRYEAGHFKFLVEEGRAQPEVYNSLKDLITHYQKAGMQ